MILADLEPGRIIRGPSGSRYRVVRLEGGFAVADSLDNSTVFVATGERTHQYLWFDQVALDRFVPDDEFAGLMDGPDMMPPGEPKEAE